MKNLLMLMIIATWCGCTTMPCCTTPVVLEIRPGSHSPAVGFTEMRVVGSEQAVYISDDVLLTNADVASSRVMTGPYGPQIEVVFTAAGAEKFAAATEDSIMKPMGILVDGRLLSAPVVQQPIRGGRAIISGSFFEEEAKRIANGIAGP